MASSIKALQQWCKQQCDGYRDVSITNMTTSFRDGLAFCAILHKHRPDLINFNSLSKENVYENNHLAFRVAEEQLGIPALLDAEDMVILRVPDRLSILTYVSQYYNYFHGRSPIGGMGAVKRPPPDTPEEPAGKKLTNHVPQPTTTPQPAKKSSPAVVENAPVRAGIREINPNSAVSSNCHICGKHVHLVQRHMADGKLYHRNCFRCKQCSRTLQPGSYKIGDHPGTFVCTNHHCNTPSPTSTSVSSTGPYAPVVSSSGGNRSSPVPTSQPFSSPNSRSWQSTTSPSVPTSTSRTATGFANKNTTDVPRTIGQESGYKTTPTVQSPANKDVPTSASTTKYDSTNRMALGFYGSPELRNNASSPLGPNKDKMATNMSNSPTTGYLQAGKGIKDISHISSSQNNSQRDAQKDLGRTAQQTKLTGASGNTITVSSLSTGKWSSPSTKDDTKEADTSSKPWVSSAAKKKEARDKFFQSSPIVPEPTTNPSSNVQESPKISVSNGLGRTDTRLIRLCKGNFKNFRPLLLDPQPNGTTVITSKMEPEKPVPKERKNKVPTSVSSPEPPKRQSTPSVSINKGIGTPRSDKSPVPAPRTQTAQPSGPGPGRAQKVDDDSSKTQNTGNKAAKSEAPEDWRSMLKSVDKKPVVQRTVHEPKPAPKEPESTTTPKKQTTITIIAPSPANKENKPVEPPVPTVTPSWVVTELPKVGPGKKKLLVAKIDLLNDWPQPELKWQEGAMTHDPEVPSWRSHWTSDKETLKSSSTDKLPVKNSIPTFVETNDVASSNKIRPEYIPEKEIQRQLEIIEQELDYLEQQGVELEKQLRSCDGDESEDSLMVDWFKLIHEKQLLLRQESELNYISRQQALENQQQDVETELRNLMNKPEHLKSQNDKTREKELLDKYLLIVNDRSEIIECLDEDRLREKEEDEMMENMIRKHSDSQQKQPSPEPNLKRRSRFSFSGWLKPKDKNKT
ncbi:LOW QUALITY PROTEIN: MICAL-like protein 2 [Bufo gargarizans]|uniref:LOW QUALITY PROTEIN: MICAL-like protein 2 n=1 Tax=Bufo gargarizans TaxID=30331 RepID=UPI001CF36A84|nr:LOW QUALITY PROTEIN: MICAL-like protein 2 [Bufo gargarizans]